MNNYLDVYIKVDKDPIDLILYLYDEMILNIQLTMKAIQENNLKQKGLLVSRVLLIITVMKACLNKEKGGVMANQLEIFYQNLEFQITQANFRQDIHLFRIIQQHISMVQSAWRHIAPTFVV